MALLLCPLLMVGCLEEDMSVCLPTFNVALTFSYLGDTNEPEMFGRMIEKVNMYIYNDANDLAEIREINKTMLDELQGVNLNLLPGQYNVVCWGNALAHTEVTSAERLPTGRLNHPNYTVGNPIPTTDHLYYGRVVLDVPESGQVEKDIPFGGAHINMRVYVSFHAYTQTDMPTISMHNLVPQYDMHMQPSRSATTTFYPATEFDSGRQMFQSIYQVLNFKDDNPAILDVRNAAGKLTATVNIKEYMAENNISVENKNEATVPILIEFTTLGVEVSVPEWESSHVTPGV